MDPKQSEERTGTPLTPRGFAVYSHFVSGITVLAHRRSYIIRNLIRVLISTRKPADNRANHLDYVPTVFVHTCAVNQVKVA